MRRLSTQPSAALVIASCLALGLVVVFNLSHVVRFDENDDVAFLQMLSGWGGAKATADIIWTNILLARPLLWLYGTWPATNWYVGYLMLAHGLALGALLYAFRPRSGRLAVQLGFLLVATGMLLRLWLRLQFTSTAIMLALAGILLLLRDAPGARDAGPRLASAVWAGTLFGLAWLVRGSAAWLILLLALPLLAWLARAVSPRRWAAFALTVAMFVGVGGAAQKAHYSGPRWEAYLAYVKRSSGLLDSRISGILGYKAMRDAGGWSDNDARIFRAWFFPDDRVHTLRSMDRLLAFAADSPVGRSRAERIERVEIGRLRYQAWFSLAGMIAVLLLMLAPARVRWWTAGFVAWTVGIFIYMAVSKKLVARVIWPYAIGATLLLLHQLDRYIPDRTIARRPWMPALVLCTGMLLGFVPQYGLSDLEAASSEYQVRAKNLRQQIRAIEAVDPQGIIVSQPTTVDFHEWPASLRTEAATPLTFIASGWAAHHPRNKALLARLGIESTVLAVLSRPHHYLLCKEVFLPLFVQYVAEHHGKRVIVRNKWLINPPQGGYLYSLGSEAIPSTQRPP